MDLSKLPGKEPGAPTHPATGTAQPPPPLPQQTDAASRNPSTELPRALWLSGPEAFLHAGVGLLVIYFGSRFFDHGTSTFSDVDGTAITYWQSWFVFFDAPLVLLGAVFIFEAIAMAAIRQRWVGWASVVLLAIAGVANVGSLIYLTPKLGLQLLTALAVLGAGYGCWSTYDKLKS